MIHFSLYFVQRKVAYEILAIHGQSPRSLKNVPNFNLI